MSKQKPTEQNKLKVLETRRRALTSLPLPKLIEESSSFAMEVESDESFSQSGCISLIRPVFGSPISKPPCISRLNSTADSQKSNLLTNLIVNSYQLRLKNQCLLFFDFTFKKFRNLKPFNFFSKHEINEKHRAKMMDWMIEVLKIYSQKEETIFRSFFFMDSYLSSIDRQLKTHELHLLGTSCMFLASKQEEIHPIKLEVFFDEVCKKKISKEEILRMELEVLITIGFQSQFPTMFDFCRCGLKILSIENERISEFVEKVSLLICKLCLFYEEIVSKYPAFMIVGGAIIMALKLVENVEFEFCAENSVF